MHRYHCYNLTKQCTSKGGLTGEYQISIPLCSTNHENGRVLPEQLPSFHRCVKYTTCDKSRNLWSCVRFIKVSLTHENLTKTVV